MLKIIREREIQTTYEYSIEYRYKDDPNAGFSFPATAHGNPDFAAMSTEMFANYKICLMDGRLSDAEFVKSERNYAAPAIGECRCGEHIELYADNIFGALCCPKCGQWYNIFGQELLSPEHWEEDYDE